MMTKAMFFIPRFSAIMLALVSLYYLIPTAFAEPESLYPIAELGGCRDNRECYLYCEVPANKPACWSYGRYLQPQVLGEQTENEEGDKEIEEKAKSLGIQFPIAELGNCNSIRECRLFCENSANTSVCMEFAKKKGLRKEGKGEIGEEEFLARAKEELGCFSKSECRAYCAAEENHARCEAFAQKMGKWRPQNTKPMTDKIKILELARSELGCDSFESCRLFCESHRDQCMEFAKKLGLFPQTQRSPENTVKQYRIQEDKAKGCDSEESCRAYCQGHPGACPGFPNDNVSTPRVMPNFKTGPSSTSKDEDFDEIESDMKKLEQEPLNQPLP